MKTTFPTTVFLALVLLSACAEMDPHPMNMDLAVQSAKTKDDHEYLAEHYEDAAKDMEQKAKEHDDLLNHYQSKSYKYGRQSQDFKAHCQRLVDAYEKAAKENLEMVKMHRQMAASSKDD